MKMKKIAAVLSAAAIAVSSFAVTAFAVTDPTPTPVTAADFAELKAALAAETTPTEITLTGQIVIDTDIDLKGVTLKATSADYNTTANGMIYITAGVTVKNCTIDGSGMDYTKNGGQGYYLIHTHHTETSTSGITLENVIVKTDKPTETNANGTTKSSIIRSYGAPLTLKNCTVNTTGKSAALKVDNTSATIDGSKIESYQPITAYGSVTVTGGSVVKANGSADAIQLLINDVVSGNTYPDNAGKLIVDNGTVDGNVNCVGSPASDTKPVIDIKENATMNNFNVTVGNTQGAPAITIDPAADIELSAAALSGGAVVNEQLAAALETAGLAVDDSGNTVVIPEGYVDLKDDFVDENDIGHSIAILAKDADEGWIVTVDFYMVNSGAWISLVDKNGDPLPDFAGAEHIVGGKLDASAWAEWNKNTKSRAAGDIKPYKYVLTEDDIEAINGNFRIYVIGENVVAKASVNAPATEEVTTTTTATEPSRPGSPSNPVPDNRPSTSESNTTSAPEGDVSGAPTATNAPAATEAPATTKAPEGDKNGDKNQATGVAFAVIPAVIAAAGVVISKKRK